ncbi:MAG: ribonuclease D [Acidimicrobiales bacterium]
MSAISYRWIDDAAGFDEVLAELADESLIGLDTEFHRERTFYPRVALVQLSWADGAQIVLVDALAVDLAPFARILDGPATIVMHAGAQDLEVLQRECATVPTQLFDTQLAAGFCGWSNPSLGTLVESIVGLRLPKGDRLADWLHRPLTDDQRDYAASDVAHLHHIHRWLVERLVADDRLAWAEDECAQLLHKATTPRDPLEAWWRVKEARSLRMPAAAIAQELAAWRELRAGEVDQPIRFVLPDLALVSIAQRPPVDVAALRRVRGLDERHLRNGAAEQILGVMVAGAVRARDELRVPPAGDVDRELRPAITLVSAWISQLGREIMIDPGLIATRGDLEAFLRGDTDARLAQGWRSQAVGANIRRLVGGEAALAFDGRGGLVLEERSGQAIDRFGRAEDDTDHAGASTTA